jgi:hypothetical protein
MDQQQRYKSFINMYAIFEIPYNYIYGDNQTKIPNYTGCSYWEYFNNLRAITIKDRRFIFCSLPEGSPFVLCIMHGGYSYLLKDYIKNNKLPFNEYDDCERLVEWTKKVQDGFEFMLLSNL